MDAELAQVLEDNKCILDALLKLEKKITEFEKKAGTFISERASGVSADALPFQMKPGRCSLYYSNHTFNCHLQNTVENMRARKLEDFKSENEALQMRVQKVGHRFCVGQCQPDVWCPRGSVPICFLSTRCSWSRNGTSCTEEVRLVSRRCHKKTRGFLCWNINKRL